MLPGAGDQDAPPPPVEGGTNALPVPGARPGAGKALLSGTVSGHIGALTVMASTALRMGKALLTVASTPAGLTWSGRPV
ncbi:hypothetical protein Msi02_65790 [Microbispora siamensis]|uniref:Uncharacterized protein n=1 Tax=Microbispora siamensis TaxID=564413 RepID=A0ABQ4GWG1_9ACTN|nr:hypothetical protein Msi02_65790 [Microbispora siamensis]